MRSKAPQEKSLAAEVNVDLSAIKRIEHGGEPVLTLAMIDEIHGRPSGTAGRNFRKHRGRMLTGKHFYELESPDEIRRVIASNTQRHPEKVILLTERGYLLLVKSFKDDLAWQVQDALVEHYFRSIEQLPSSHLVGHEIARGIREGLEQGLAPIQEDVRRVENKVDNIDLRLSKLEKRRDLVATTKRQHIDTVVKFFGGRCPCCGIQEVVDQHHCKTEDANWEHWFSPSKNRAHETWLVCRDCNIKLRDDFAFKHKHDTSFKSYQMRREQKHYPLLTQ